MTIQQIQNLLQYLGYYTLKVDGVWGQGSKQATMDFQRAESLTEDGDPGPNTQTRLIDAVAKGRFKPIDVNPPAINEAESPSWWSTIKNFSRNEFRCPCGKCGGFPVEPDKNLVLTMDQMRDDFGTAIIVVPPDGHSGGSGVRCQAYNDSLSGSVSNSRHVLGKAADFSSPGKPQSTVEAYLSNLQKSGKIRYWYRISNGSWHMDVQ